MTAHYRCWLRMLSTALVVVAYASCQAAAQNQASTGAPPTAAVFLSAVDKAGRPVAGLQAADLAVFVDKKPQAITRLSAAPAERVQLMLSLDVSGSRRRTYSKLDYQGIASFLHKTPHLGADTAIIAFAKTVSILTDWTGDFAQIESALHQAAALQPHGPTALYDAIYWACQAKLPERSGRRVLVVVSDIGDNSSEHTRDEAIEQAQRNEILIYPIVIGRDSSDYYQARRAGAYLARELATRTGGLGYLSESGADMKNTLGRITEILAGSYLVEFSLPTDIGSEKGRKKGHKIDIRCHRKNVTVLFRRRLFPQSERVAAK